ncbi:MAG: hypothetical protein ABR981_02515 [Candidatus Micrarchaeaceae archaeon]|jgi:hypothetical protein
MDLGKFTYAFENFLQKDPQFSEVFNIIKSNSEGNIWIIGGYVYKGITSEFYGSEISTKDYDFIVESKKGEPNLPGWEISNSRYGNVKIHNSKTSIDLVPLKNVFSIIKRNIDPTIDNYLTGTPLTVQSIAYDCSNKKIIGEVGCQSIEDKTVGINYYESAHKEASLKGITINDFIKSKSDILGFTPILI